MSKFQKNLYLMHEIRFASLEKRSTCVKFEKLFERNEARRGTCFKADDVVIKTKNIYDLFIHS